MGPSGLCVICLRTVSDYGHSFTAPTDKDVMLAAHRYVEEPPFREWLSRAEPRWASFFARAMP